MQLVTNPLLNLCSRRQIMELRMNVLSILLLSINPLLQNLPQIHQTNDESSPSRCTTSHGHSECSNDWSPNRESTNHPLPSFPSYQLHHRALGHTIEPQHIRILDDTAVVAVHFAPSIGVVATLFINHAHTSRTAVFAQCGSVKNSFTSPAYLVSG